MRALSRRFAPLLLSLGTLTLAALAAREVGAQAAWTPPSDSAVRALVAEKFGSSSNVAVAVAWLDPRDHSRSSFVGWGITRPGGGPVTRNTVFEIGSITKTFTTAVLADMVRKGEVSLDDPVQKYLPADAKIPAREGKPITLRALASQSSGLPRMPGNFAPKDRTNPFADYTDAQMYAFLSSYTLPRDPGAQYEYSNLGMGLLGVALARKAGMSYEELITKRVLQPLGMKDTRTSLTADMRARLAQGHNEAGSEAPAWDFDALAGAGAIRSTTDDMLKYLAAVLDTTKGPLAKDMALAQPGFVDVGSGSNMKVGLAWHVIKRPSSEIVWHNGQTGAYHAFMGVDHTTGANVLVLASITTSIDEIGLSILGVPIPKHAPSKQHTEITLEPAVLDRYVGVYDFGPSFSLTITREGNSLFGAAPGQPKLQLLAESETDFFVKAVDASVTFVKDASGKVTSIVLHQGGADQTGTRR